MQAHGEQRGRTRNGQAVILAGVATFLVGSFLPFYRIEPTNETLSFASQELSGLSDGPEWVLGGILLLFAATAVLVVTAAIGLGERARASAAPPARRDGRAARARHGAVARVRPGGALPGAAPGGRSAGDRLPDRGRSGRDGRATSSSRQRGCCSSTGRGHVGRTGHGVTRRRASGQPRIDPDAVESRRSTLVICLGAAVLRPALPIAPRPPLERGRRARGDPVLRGRRPARDVRESSAPSPPSRVLLSMPVAVQEWSLAASMARATAVRPQPGSTLSA